MSTVILNSHNLSDILNGDPTIIPPKEEVRKSTSSWVLDRTNAVIHIPGKLTYTTATELIQKLNAIDGWLQNGELKIDSDVYQVKVYEGLHEYSDFSSFGLLFISDGYRYITYEFQKQDPLPVTRASIVANPLDLINVQNSIRTVGANQPIIIPPSALDTDMIDTFDDFVSVYDNTVIKKKDGQVTITSLTAPQQLLDEGFTEETGKIVKKVDMTKEVK